MTAESRPSATLEVGAADTIWRLLQAIWAAAAGNAAALERVRIIGSGSLPSAFAVSDLAAASVSAAGLALSELTSRLGRPAPSVTVDRRLASLWFGFSIRPDGWAQPAPWDALAGDYRTRDGWIKLHTNAPHHRAAALATLKAEADREAVERAVGTWRAEDLESAIVAAGGCAAKLRSAEEWREHPQGRSLASEPLIDRLTLDTGPGPVLQGTAARPLAGLRVLDLTRVLAGPVATRFLAGYGAEVLRIDPPDWDEPSLAPEVMIGKRGARLDLRTRDGRSRLLDLLSGADVLVHGYRPDALEQLGLGLAVRRATRPGLVEATLDAYGWSGPWAGRRGFDSLVQMSSGIAHTGMMAAGADRPVSLPVQALDQATGYILATTVLLGLCDRLDSGRGVLARSALARTADLLLTAAASPPSPEPAIVIADEDWSSEVETTAWGPARRLKSPLVVEGAPMGWDHPAQALGSGRPEWPGPGETRERRNPPPPAGPQARRSDSTG